MPLSLTVLGHVPHAQSSPLQPPESQDVAEEHRTREQRSMQSVSPTSDLHTGTVLHIFLGKKVTLPFHGAVQPGPCLPSSSAILVQDWVNAAVARLPAHVYLFIHLIQIFLNLEKFGKWLPLSIDSRSVIWYFSAFITNKGGKVPAYDCTLGMLPSWGWTMGNYQREASWVHEGFVLDSAAQSWGGPFSHHHRAGLNHFFFVFSRMNGIKQTQILNSLFV